MADPSVLELPICSLYFVLYPWGLSWHITVIFNLLYAMSLLYFTLTILTGISKGHLNHSIDPGHPSTRVTPTLCRYL